MRDICIIILSFCILILTMGHCMQQVRIANLERLLKRVERGYNEVLEANEQLERVNNQNLRLMTEGGWDAILSTGTSN